MHIPCGRDTLTIKLVLEVHSSKMYVHVCIVLYCIPHIRDDKTCDAILHMYL